VTELDLQKMARGGVSVAEVDPDHPLRATPPIL
jgi:hypothetical protein